MSHAERNQRRPKAKHFDLSITFVEKASGVSRLTSELDLEVHDVLTEMSGVT